MRVVVVEMRAAGAKLTRDELASASAHEGELFIEQDMAMLCGGTRRSEWPTWGRVLPPLYFARVRKLKGDSFVIVGRYLRDGTNVRVDSVQAWWCRLAPDAPLRNPARTILSTST